MTGVCNDTIFFFLAAAATAFNEDAKPFLQCGERFRERFLLTKAGVVTFQ